MREWSIPGCCLPRRKKLKAERAWYCRGAWEDQGKALRTAREEVMLKLMDTMMAVRGAGWFVV